MNRKGKILFVDDDEIVLLLLHRLLSDEYEIELARSGPEALDILSEQTFDVIVTDIRMPDMDGLDLLNIVKKLYPHMVRIVLSGYTQVHTIISVANHGGIFRFITKPIQINEETKTFFRNAVEHAHAIQEECRLHRRTLDTFIQLLEDQEQLYLLCDENRVIVSIHPSLRYYFPDNKLPTTQALERDLVLGDQSAAGRELITKRGVLPIKRIRQTIVYDKPLMLIYVGQEAAVSSAGGLAIG
ncbi:hypothetical protein DNH61_17425 [Paenibacillus sambharensis]|uniref:Response regulatory domain-containing protein n=1 Tax=Paenibacillus sambharensis TaxID=1803190 RepID=A0A2W1L7E2_9BACL|nr:response regulator [Paenibacillus sambharensis]PZD94729.1 hypothetical protein DNH61_17425 [Paenibacillus sambharensis]